MTRRIHVGDVAVGGGGPVVVQSMCNTPPEDVAGTLAQIGRLAALGCRIIRCALPRESAVAPFREICAGSPLPVIADIHFDYRLALSALSAGAAGVRINPGNIRSADGIRQVAECAAQRDAAVRIGVNMGSLSPQSQSRHGRTAEAMVASALEYLAFFEDAGCRNLKVSLKSSSISETVAACRRFHELSQWPQHIGLTESGTPETGVIKSAIAIGALLMDGIGDTIRVSLTAPPEAEIPAAYRILDALGLRPGRPQLVSCPTCGRTRIDLIRLAGEVENAVNRILASGRRLNLKKIAVMGCEVNGPGEAADADLGIAGGNGRGMFFSHGRVIRTFPESELLPRLLEELEKHIADPSLPPSPAMGAGEDAPQ